MQPNPLVADFIVSNITNRIDEIVNHRFQLNQDIIGALVRLDRELSDLAAEVEVSQRLLGMKQPALHAAR